MVKEQVASDPLLKLISDVVNVEDVNEGCFCELWPATSFCRFAVMCDALRYDLRVGERAGGMKGEGRGGGGVP